jgi:hypothetical protein
MDAEISGIEFNTSVEVELIEQGIVEIFTDAPKTCCVSVVKLDAKGVDKLIVALQQAKKLIEEVK